MAVNRLFIDTGALIATDLPRDQFYERSREAWAQLSHSATQLYSSEAIFQETMMLLHLRAGPAKAILWAETHLQSKLISWLPVDTMVRKASLPWMKKFAGQAISFVDATSFALMRRENIRHVLGFDQHFVAAGFRLWPD